MKHMISILAAVSLSTLANAETVTGKIVDENGNPLQATIAVGSKTINTNKDGSFSADVNEQAIHQFNISADGYYSMLHTFSRYELKAASFKIPAITLVHKAPNRSLMLFTGDTMMGRRYYKPHEGEPQLIHEETEAKDTKEILAHVKPYIELADFSATNLETQVFAEEPKEKAIKSVTFFTRPAALDALKWAGIDYVTLGNNHTYDFLEYGVKETLSALDQKGLKHSGAGFNEAEALEAYSVTLGGTSYAFEGYVGWAGSGKISQAADVNKGGPALGTSDNIVRSVKRDRAQSHTPIVQYHGSLEYGDEPSLDTETRLKQAVDAGAALAIAHHPHVYQGLELYKDSLIAWSLGNFVFDQYFYAPQETALLYVWMDDGKFHRAEVVPLYVKGYKPTPATGAMRHSIMKRIAALSAKRGTYMQQSGGHGFITADNKAPNAQTIQLTASYKGNMEALHSLNWAKPIQIEGAANKAFRLGEDMLARGDFETYSTFSSPDRSWLDLNPETTLSTGTAYSGANSLKIRLSNGKPVLTGMRKFARVFTPGTPMSISLMGKTNGPVKVRFYLQRRKTNDRLFDALNNNPHKLLGETILDGDWQQTVIHFDSPRVGTKSIRMLIEVESLSTQATEIFMDDISLIEWKTPFMQDPTTIDIEQDVSHIGW